MNKTLWRKWTVGVLLLVLLLATTACEGDVDSAFLSELASIFLPEVISYGVLGTSGDQSLDAIFQSASVLKDIEEADRLREQALWNRDPSLMEQAIELRPQDTSIRLDSMEQYTALGNLEAAQRQLREAELVVVDKPVEDRKALVEDVIVRFEAMKAYGDERIYESRQECLWIHQELQVKYDTLWTLNGNEGPSPAGQDIQREALKCAERSP